MALTNGLAGTAVCVPLSRGAGETWSTWLGHWGVGSPVSRSEYTALELSGAQTAVSVRSCYMCTAGLVGDPGLLTAGKVLSPGLSHVPPFCSAAIAMGGLRLTTRVTRASHPHMDHPHLVP